MCISQLRRQKEAEPTCNVFAIEDCVAFQRDPDLMPKVRAGKGLTLPPAMMTFVSQGSAIEKAIEHQLLVMNPVPKDGE